MEENNILIYKDENNATQLDVKLDNGMIWVTRQQLATLFGRDTCLSLEQDALERCILRRNGRSNSKGFD